MTSSPSDSGDGGDRDHDHDHDRPWTEQDFWEERFRDGDTPWDTGAPSPALVNMESHSSLPLGAAVMVPGCGLGNDALHLASLGYKVSAVDWSRTAVDSVRAFAKRKNLEVEVLASDFWEIPPSWYGTFDALFEHTFFCAIDPSERKIYVEQLLRLLKPKGQFMGSLFIRESHPEPVRYEINLDRSGPPFWSTEAEIRGLFEASFEILRLERSPHFHPKVRQPEWFAHFRRRG